jgi:hypothetical protein
MEKLISVACITGFVGDILLQTGSIIFHLGGQTGWGLKSYFEQHGTAESTFIAGGMMTLFYVFYIIYLRVANAPPSYLHLAIYGVLLDLFFRKTRLFASLDGYYRYFNYFWSAVWMAIPMMIPLFIFNTFMI